VLLFLALSLLPQRGGAQQASQLEVSAASHGIRLTLRLSNRIYPRNALVRATVVVQNVSRKRAWVPYSAECLTWNPGLVVMDGTGKELYPPGLKSFLPPPCPPPVPNGRPLDPGKSLTAHLYAVLRARYLHARLDYYRTLNRRPGSVLSVQTPSIRVPPLAAADPPPASLTGAPGSAVLQVSPPPGVHGPPLYEDSAACPYTSDTGMQGTQYQQTLFWLRSADATITPDCSPIIEWHVVAGWLNHSVVSVDWP
jgi:hypothetical protein